MLDALEDAENRSRRAADQTRQFLADAAHELRTPLAGIQALAQTIATHLDSAPEGEDPERRRRHARLLLR